jgi:hypothetical protein
MNSTKLKVFKHNRKIICYIKEFKGIYYVNTGKPSDANCISWTYNNIQEAEKTANEFFTNYTSKKIQF